MYNGKIIKNIAIPSKIPLYSQKDVTPGFVNANMIENKKGRGTI